MKKSLFLFVLLLLLAACGGDTAAEPEPVAVEAESIAVEMHDIYFGEANTNLENPPVWTVSAGAEVSVTLNNLGSLEHNWAVVAMGQEVPVPYTGGAENSDLFYWSADLVPPGESKTYTFTAPTESGEYLVICTVAGHYPLMQGRLVVE